MSFCLLKETQESRPERRGNEDDGDPVTVAENEPIRNLRDSEPVDSLECVSKAPIRLPVVSSNFGTSMDKDVQKSNEIVV